jgi:predicted Fe-S protein YdhL (DUF1289 family)
MELEESRKCGICNCCGRKEEERTDRYDDTRRNAIWASHISGMGHY